LRRYSKENKYAIPYNGEEVLLYWANQDQYYIKTGEYFQNYSFKIGDYKVNFKVSKAEVDKNNIKTTDRYFFLKSGEGNIVFDSEKKGLTIFFEYRGLSEEEEKIYGLRNVQENIINYVKDTILERITDSSLKRSLERVKDGDKKTLLEKHLNTYTKKNTTDYFIHKDLKGFLERELDFYIKNEVLMLDELGSEKEPSIERYITKVRVIKSISQKIIEFLAQIEEFQKKLWEKKKFIVKTEYCMTLDKVPEEFYEEIVQNESQINEWKELFKLEEVEKGTLEYTANGGLKIDVEYLKSNPYLVLDTKFFSQDFKNRLLATFEDLDEEIGGLMIKSENWQALSLLLEKYREKVKCIYIDPPYNTGSDEFIYKDNYQHSSWLTMMEDRLRLARDLLKNDGVFYVSIDDNEIHELKIVLNKIFGENNHLSDLIWDLGTGTTAGHFTRAHEYILAFAKDKSDLPNFDDPSGGSIIHGALKKISRANPASEILFPAGIEYEGNNAEFSGCLGTSEQQFILDEKMVFENGKLKYPVRLKAGWAMRNQILSWLEGKETYDTKGQRIKRFFFNKQGILWYEKERGKINPKTVLSKIASTKDGSSILKNIMGEQLITFPKPPKLIEFLIKLCTKENDIIMDFFAGSGTTAHAVLNANKEDEKNRKYILVEMGDYFDSVMKPRIQRVMYSKDWKDGKPTSKDGISHMFKYQYLEQYEDVLNNIEFVEAGAIQKTLEDMDDYFLRYMLDFETRDSPCRLNVDKLGRPFEYKLKIINSENEIREEIVDLVETFNYLLGLHVMKMRAYKNNGAYYRVVIGKKGDETIVVVWRNLDGLDLKADKEFIEGTVLKDFEVDIIYVNGDSYIENARSIEPEFKRLVDGQTW
jgi:adenine-specific DNA-methyltransferase